MFTKEQIARAALEAGVGAEKIKEMLKLLGDTTVLRSDECAGRNAEVTGYSQCSHIWYFGDECCRKCGAQMMKLPESKYRLVPVRDNEGVVVGQQYS